MAFCSPVPPRTAVESQLLRNRCPPRPRRRLLVARSEFFRNPNDRPLLSKVLDGGERLTALTTSNAVVVLADKLAAEASCSKATVLCWVRHYGCTLCRKQIRELTELLRRPTMHGVSLAAVGSGTPEQASRLREELSFPGEIYSDPERRSYAALGFANGMLSTFNLGGLVRTVESFAEGNQQKWGEIPTDPFQQGGCLVLDNGGNVAAWHRDDFAGDHLRVEQLEEICAWVAGAP